MAPLPSMVVENPQVCELLFLTSELKFLDSYFHIALFPSRLREVCNRPIDFNIFTRTVDGDEVFCPFISASFYST